METFIEQQFLDFFQEFIKLCHLHNWPKNDTNPKEIRNAFLIAQHIEKCLDKLQEKCLLNEFLCALNKNQYTSNRFLKKCLLNPSKYILNKIIISSTEITVMDVGFKVFLDLYCEEKLEEYLSDIMLEAASKDTLIKNMVLELSIENRLEFKCHSLLSKLNDKEGSMDVVKKMLKNCTQDVMDILVLCLINKEMKYNEAIKVVANEFVNVMSNLNGDNKNFWKILFHTDTDVFLQVCLCFSHIFELIVKALIDCGKLLNKGLSMKKFYIELTYSELVSNVQKICKVEDLKQEFISILQVHNEDMIFWYKLLT